jgi:hypothetical protein
LGRYAEFILGEGIVPNGSPEHLQYMEWCVESEGFDVQISDGGLLAHTGSAQEPRYREVLALCEQTAVDRGLVKAQGPPDSGELAAWYEAFGWTHDCLVENGYPVSDPPSLDLYIESRGRNWHPYDMLDPMELAQVEGVCPQDLIVIFEILASNS